MIYIKILYINNKHFLKSVAYFPAAQSCFFLHAAAVKAISR